MKPTEVREEYYLKSPDQQYLPPNASIFFVNGKFDKVTLKPTERRVVMKNFQLLVVKNPKKMSEEYIISSKDNNNIWITDGTGEGGEISAERFFECIDKFYKENF